MTLPETVTIPTADYLRLLESDFTLNGLQAAGVDNWEGYSEAGWERIEQRMDAARAALEVTP